MLSTFLSQVKNRARNQFASHGKEYRVYVLKFGILFFAYLLTARLGSTLFFATNNGQALIWPPAGIAVAGLFLGGFRLWPAIILAALTNSIINSSPIGLAIPGGIGHTLQAFTATYILKRFQFSQSLSRLRDTLLLFMVAFFISGIGPLFTQATGVLFYNYEWSFAYTRFLTVWLGGLISIVLITPLITSWWGVRPKFQKKDFLEGLAVYALLGVTTYSMFWLGKSSVLGISLVYFLLLPLFWLSLRFHSRYITLSLFLVTVVEVAGLFYGKLTFEGDALGRRLMQIELFTLILCAIYYILATVSNERKNVTQTLQNHIKQLEDALETIRQHALHDGLTGLQNRKALEERFDLARSMAIRHDQKLGLLFLDLDQFKTINDTLGHSVGDDVLRKIANRLKNSVRAIDTVARFGGDEFIIVLGEVNSETEIETVASKILQTIAAKPVKVGDHIVPLRTSVGVAIFPEAGEDLDTLLKCADMALYRAKDKGKNCYQFYNQEMKHQLHTKISLEQALRKAVENQEMHLVYQPYVDLKTDKIMGVEALIRWNHPQFGLLEPNQFIGIAEESGHIIPIGNWVMNRACQQARQWKMVGINLPISVNLSLLQFYSSNLAGTIAAALGRHDLKPTDLELEITETVAMENKAYTNQHLSELAEMGISLTMDDFGTGYSSLSNIKGLKVKKIKIDKSFVHDVIYDKHDETIIKTIISMGKALGLKVCAEGIETTQQKELLKEIGCEMGQGFLMCKPLEASEFVSWLQNQKVRELSMH